MMSPFGIAALIGLAAQVSASPIRTTTGAISHDVFATTTSTSGSKVSTSLWFLPGGRHTHSPEQNAYHSTMASKEAAQASSATEMPVLEARAPSHGPHMYEYVSTPLSLSHKSAVMPTATKSAAVCSPDGLDGSACAVTIPAAADAGDVEARDAEMGPHSRHKCAFVEDIHGSPNCLPTHPLREDGHGPAVLPSRSSPISARSADATGIAQPDTTSDTLSDKAFHAVKEIVDAEDDSNAGKLGAFLNNATEVTDESDWAYDRFLDGADVVLEDGKLDKRDAAAPEGYSTVTMLTWTDRAPAATGAAIGGAGLNAATGEIPVSATLDVPTGIVHTEGQTLATETPFPLIPEIAFMMKVAEATIPEWTAEEIELARKRLTSTAPDVAFLTKQAKAAFFEWTQGQVELARKRMTFAAFMELMLHAPALSGAIYGSKNATAPHHVSADAADSEDVVVTVKATRTLAPAPFATGAVPFTGTALNNNTDSSAALAALMAHHGIYIAPAKDADAADSEDVVVTVKATRTLAPGAFATGAVPVTAATLNNTASSAALAALMAHHGIYIAPAKYASDDGTTRPIPAILSGKSLKNGKASEYFGGFVDANGTAVDLRAFAAIAEAINATHVKNHFQAGSYVRANGNGSKAGSHDTLADGLFRGAEVSNEVEGDEDVVGTAGAVDAAGAAMAAGAATATSDAEDSEDADDSEDYGDSEDSSDDVVVTVKATHTAPSVSASASASTSADAAEDDEDFDDVVVTVKATRPAAATASASLSAYANATRPHVAPHASVSASVSAKASPQLVVPDISASDASDVVVTVTATHPLAATASASVSASASASASINPSPTSALWPAPPYSSGIHALGNN